MGYPIAEMPGSVERVDRQPDTCAKQDEARAPRIPAHAAPAGRLPLRAIAPVAARTARLVCDARTVLALQRVPGLDAWQAALCDAPATGDVHAFHQPGMLELAHPAGPIYVTFDLAGHPALDMTAWPAESGTAAPSDAQRALRVAVAGLLLDPLLQRLAALGLTGLRVVRLIRGIAQPITRGDTVPIALSFTFEGRSYAAEITLAPAVLNALENLPATQSSGLTHAALPHPASSVAGHARFPDCLIPGRAILGARRLPVETLRALMPGDVLLRSLAIGNVAASTGDAHAQSAAVAAWGTPGLIRLHASVAIEGQMLTIMKEPTMTDELDPVRLDDTLAPPQPENPIDIGELDLPVQFEVDTVALPLSQLYALRPGYVLELPTPVADAQLKLVTHGQTIGYGELVTVGEHLGVRILRMAHGDGPVQ
jgi:type III secretion protein Q